MGHTHGIHDSDVHFTINAITRAIKNDSPRKSALIQYDHNSERFTFKCPRYIEGHDMSICNRVEVHYLNIETTTRKQRSGLYEITDLQINPEDKNSVTCSWLISQNATGYVGVLNFLVRFCCVSAGVIEYAWNTAIATIDIATGIDASGAFESEYADVIAQWKAAVMQHFTDNLGAWKDRTEQEITQAASDEIIAKANAFSAEWNSALAAERARIDSFMALGEGSTTGDAELQDIRIGTNGTVYSTAGTAIRTQLHNLQSNVENMFSSGCMRLFPKWERGGINGSSGNETTAEGRFRTTDFLALGLSEITIHVADGYMVYFFGYERTGAGYTLSVHGSCTKDKTVSIDASLHYRFVVRNLDEADYMEEAELANVDFIISPEIIYATNAALALANNAIQDIAQYGRWSLQSPWAVQGINGGNGTINDATNRIRTTEYFKPISDTIHYAMADGYRMLFFEYVKDGETGEYTFARSGGYYTGEGDLKASVDCYYLFVLRAVEDVEFNGNEYTNISIYSPIKVYTPEDEFFSIPEYWADSLAAKEKEIKNIVVEATKAGNDVSMFFTTADPHYPANTYVSTALRKYLGDRCGISLTVCLGDLITDSIVSHEEGLQRIQEAMSYLSKGTDRMIFTQGNHDNNAGILDSNGLILSERIVYDNEWIHHTSAKLLSLSKVVFDEKRKAFYYDDDLQKIRFISIDSFEDKTYTIVDGDVKSYNLGKPSSRQIEWIRNEALKNVPAGYAVISFSHLALNAPRISNGSEYITLTAGKIGNSVALVGVFEEFKNNGGVYIGHFAGHLHHDFVSSVGGITCVQSLNDGTHWREANYFGPGFEFIGDAPLKTEGTNTECAFDAVIINRTTRHVDLVRIGAGENRSFDF